MVSYYRATCCISPAIQPGIFYLSRRWGALCTAYSRFNGAIVLHGSRSSIWHGLLCHGTPRYYAGMRGKINKLGVALSREWGSLYTRRGRDYIVVSPSFEEV